MKAGRIFKLGLSWVVVMGWGAVALAQAPDTLWTRTYGGEGNELAFCIQPTLDGGYIVAGGTELSGYPGSYCYLVKIDSVGDTLWTRTYGQGYYSSANCVIQTSDGGYMIVGYTTDYSGPEEAVVFLIIKTDQDGDTLWTRTYGTVMQDEANGVLETSDGGYVIAGSSAVVDFWMIKIDANGDSLWSGFYSGGLRGACYSLAESNDGGYVLAGFSQLSIFHNDNAYVVKTDIMGNAIWARRYEFGGDSYACCIKAAHDSGYVVVGASAFGYFMLKLSENGDEIWIRYFDHRCLGSIELTYDGQYVVSGSIWEPPSDNYQWIMKTDRDGMMLWEMVPEDSIPSSGLCIKQTQDMGYIVAGGRGFSIYGDMYVVKTTPDTLSVFVRQNRNTISPTSFWLHTPYPDPFNPTTTISYEVPVRGRVRVNIFNILGQEVATLVDGVVSPGSYLVVWDAKDLPSGIYFVRMEATGFQKTQKVMLLK